MKPKRAARGGFPKDGTQAMPKHSWASLPWEAMGRGLRAGGKRHGTG